MRAAYSRVGGDRANVNLAEKSARLILTNCTQLRKIYLSIFTYKSVTVSVTASLAS